MSVSIYDIAKKAGVSPSTVSRALEDHPRIGATTRKRIQELAREMDYVPSTVAKSLAANKTWTIGMVLATISDPFMGRVIEGVEQAAIEAGFNVFISTSQNDRQREIAAIKMLQKRRVDGIIVIASHLFDQYPRFYGRSKVPIVIINEQKPGETMHFVTVDDVQGAQLAVEHFIALGHCRIGFVGVTNRPQSNQYRFKGYQKALEAAASAIGLLAACHKRGLSVPDNLSIVGFDDIDMATYTIPPLTTIRQPRFGLGQQAMHMMLALLAGQEPENQVVPGELVVRQTTTQLLPCENLEAAS